MTGVDAALRLLYVHVEVQTQRDEAFARRMFTYNHRLLDRWRGPVASFAVLAYDTDSQPGGEISIAIDTARAGPVCRAGLDAAPATAAGV